MPDGTIAYYQEEISRKLTLIMHLLDDDEQKVVQEILESDLPELIELVKVKKDK